jgi:Flp pilus assembly protein TadG
MVIAFGSIEASQIVYVKRAVQEAAYEAAHLACTPPSTSSNVQSKGLSILQTFGVHDGQVGTTPGEVSGLAEGSRITVTVTAPIGSNRVLPEWFFGAGDLSAQCTVLRE